jgi:hypothetical protein
MGGVEPPYTVRIANVGAAPKEVIAEVVALSSAIRNARKDRRDSEGVDIDVTISCPELSV